MKAVLTAAVAGISLAVFACVSVSFRAAIVLAALLSAPGFSAEQPRETDTQRDLRVFYQQTGNRAVWIDRQGRPTEDATRALGRLGRASEDGLADGDYDAAELTGEAAALHQSRDLSAVDAASFDVRLTENVLKFFRHLHLGRANPRDFGFHLDHAIEPHDFPRLLQSALSDHTFDRVLDDLRPPFVQYRELARALNTYRTDEPARARQIEMALERMRWLPDLRGQRLLVVNIPMFYLWGWEQERSDGVPSIGMAAIIGRAGTTKTPVFTAAMTSVVFNPYWNVPDSIVRNEILPALQRDPQYLDRNHMEILSGEGTSVRQRPGPWNALGKIKFMLPNPHDVYLHGTPAQELFSRSRRDFSHGCVRVEDPVRLAEWVLKGQGDWTREKILAEIDVGATRAVGLLHQLRIVMFYMTAAFMPDEGAVRFADDIYGHDARLDAWLQARTDRGE
jgi:murein L,D-transpeptidase YcbB/YkuD